MSSPLANKCPTRWQNALIAFHQKCAHTNRIAKLADVLARTLSALQFGSNENIRVLDVGCGDMRLAETIHSLIPKSQWTCIDIHKLTEDLQSSSRWRKYLQFDGKHLPFPEQSFHVVLFADVLHHCMANAKILLAEGLRVGSFVVVKDHFEYGYFSRLCLRLMDFLGNYGYGVAVPKFYFTRHSFERLCACYSAAIISNHIGIDLYSDLPMGKYLTRKEWQFVATLKKSP